MQSTTENRARFEGPGRRPADPTPEEITARAAGIRAGWSARDWRWQEWGVGGPPRYAIPTVSGLGVRQ